MLYEDGRKVDLRGAETWLSNRSAFSTTLDKTSTYVLVAKNRKGKTTRRKLTVKVAAPQKANSTISVTIIGTYKKYASEIGVFESVSGRRGKFLFKKPVTTVRDHREGRESTIYRSKFTLAPGKYFIVPKGG